MMGLSIVSRETLIKGNSEYPIINNVDNSMFALLYNEERGGTITECVFKAKYFHEI